MNTLEVSVDLFESEQGDEDYLNIRNGNLPYGEEARNYWNLMYTKYRHHLDKDYKERFPGAFMNRLWELTFANYLNSHSGINLLNIPQKGKESVPDFYFSHKDKSFM